MGEQTIGWISRGSGVLLAVGAFAAVWIGQPVAAEASGDDVRAFEKELAGHYSRKEFAQAVAKAEKACGRTKQPKVAGLACLYLGGAHLSGEFGLSRDVDKGRKYLEKACTVGGKERCKQVAKIGTALVGQSDATSRKTGRKLVELACKKDVYRGCRTLAEATEALVERGNYGAAVPSLKLACGQGVGKGCGLLGALYLEGKGVPRDASKGRALLRKGCEKRSRGACGRLAKMYMTGSYGVGRDAKKSVGLAKKACRTADSSSDEASCRLLRKYYAQRAKALERAGDRYGAIRMRQQANKYGCLGGSARNCVDARKLVQATRLYKEGCQGGDSGDCYAWGTLLEKPRSKYAGADPEGALAAFEKGCKMGHRKSCGKVEKQQKHQGRHAEACEKGDVSACFLRAGMFERGEDVKVNHLKAARLYEKACKGGRKEGCYRAGLMVKHFNEESGWGMREPSERLYAETREHFKAGCDKGHLKSCHEWGFMVLYGRGGAEDAEKASRLFDRACHGGVMGACAALAARYRRGDGVAKSARRAKELLQKSCRGGHKPACRSLKSR